MVSLRKDYRTASLFRADFRARAQDHHRQIREIDRFKQADVMDALKRATRSGSASMLFDRTGSIVVGEQSEGSTRVTIDEIEEVKVDDALVGWALRISHSNPFASDPGAMDLGTRKIDKLIISERRPLYVGAHLFIGRTGIGAYPYTCKCVLELVPSLSRSKVLLAIQRIADEHMSDAERPSYTYKAKKGKFVSGLGKLIVSHYSEKSETLQQDLNEKYLENITFLGEPTKSDEVSISGLEVLEHRIVSKVEKNSRSGPAAKGVLERAAEFARNNLFRMKAEFSYDAVDGEKKRVREIDLDNSGFFEQAYTRTEYINIDQEFSSFYESMDWKIVEDFVEKINDSSLWVG